MRFLQIMSKRNEVINIITTVGDDSFDDILPASLRTTPSKNVNFKFPKQNSVIFPYIPEMDYYALADVNSLNVLDNYMKKFGLPKDKVEKTLMDIKYLKTDSETLKRQKTSQRLNHINLARYMIIIAFLCFCVYIGFMYSIVYNDPPANTELIGMAFAVFGLILMLIVIVFNGKINISSKRSAKFEENSPDVLMLNEVRKIIKLSNSEFRILGFI